MILKKRLKLLKHQAKSFLFDHCIYALQLEDKGFLIHIIVIEVSMIFIS